MFFLLIPVLCRRSCRPNDGRRLHCPLDWSAVLLGAQSGAHRSAGRRRLLAAAERRLSLLHGRVDAARISTRGSVALIHT